MVGNKEREDSQTEGTALPEGNIVDTGDSYKHLGIPKANGNHEVAARKAAASEYGTSRE